MKINVTYLKSIGACNTGLDHFRRAFPRGLTVKPGARLTPRMAERLASVARHFDWFAEYVPTTAWSHHRVRAEAEYVRAEAEAQYVRATGPARAEYDRAGAVAWAEYDRAVARAEYDRDRAVARAEAEYDRATGPARAEYVRVRAGALWRALGGA